MANIREYVLHCLTHYHALDRQIQLLQFELSAMTSVSSDDMIEMLTFSRGEYAGTSGHISDKTARIALSYQEKADEINKEARTALMDQLRPLLLQKERLDRCMTYLSVSDQKVLTSLYIQEQSVKSLATEMHLSERTIQRYRDHAIEELISMYALLERAGVALK